MQATEMKVSGWAGIRGGCSLTACETEDDHQRSSLTGRELELFEHRDRE